VTGPPPRPASNPFATRHTQPGSLPPLDADGKPLDLALLVARLQRLPSRTGAIVGPHGSGKTNLLVHLARLLAETGGCIGPLRARSCRDVAGIMRAILAAPPGTITCIDSWEQLGWPGRLVVRASAAWRRVGLVVTSHCETELPTLIECHTSRTLLERLVERLPGAGGMSQSDIDDAFARHGGNLRDSLAELYDRFEACRR
jgi:energy-coupling factor transporter ATP-binding protein EcfA2